MTKSKKFAYTYDNNGNILTKSVNGVVTSYAYEEGTDRLTSYGAETIGYDGMGNPKSYRGSELTWGERPAADEHRGRNGRSNVWL